MNPTNAQRSTRFRARRRKDALAVMVAVRPEHRRALEALGLLAAGAGTDKVVVAGAVERFLDAAPAVQAMGDALFPDVS